MTTWRGDTLVAEAGKNLAARPGRSLIIAAIVFGTVLSVSLGDLYTARGVERSNRSLIAQGYTSVKVTADPPGVSAADCARLDGQRGIVAAGGVGPVETAHAGSSPGLGFWQATTTGDATTALAGIRTPNVGRPGLVLSSDLADELGVTVGSFLNIGGRPLRVAGVFPLGQRDQLLGRIALVPTAPTGFEQACYVQFATGDFASGTTSLVAAFPGAVNIAVQPLVPRGPGSANPAESWHQSSTRFAWLPAGLILGAIALLMARNRRHELSVYILTGSWRFEAAAIYLCEMQLVLSAGGLSAISWTAFLSVLMHAGWEPFHVALLALIRALLLATSLVPLGTLPLFRRDLTRLLRERAS